MEYAALSPEQQAEILRSRLVSHEAQHFQAQLDLDAVKANKDLPGQDEQVAALQARIADIERVHAAESKKLKALSS